MSFNLFMCEFKFNIFKIRDEGYEFKKDLSEELSLLSLIINEQEYNLKKILMMEIFHQLMAEQ